MKSVLRAGGKASLCPTFHIITSTDGCLSCRSDLHADGRPGVRLVHVFGEAGVPDGPDGSLGSVGNPDFSQDRLHVHLYRRLSDGIHARDHLVRVAPDERPQNLLLALGKAVTAAAVCGAIAIGPRQRVARTGHRWLPDVKG